MPRPFCLGLALLAASGMLPGCARRELQPSELLARPMPPPVVVEDVTSSPPAQLHFSGPGTLNEVEQKLGPPPQPTSSRTLLADETQCLAAANSKLANLVELERQAVARAAGCVKKTAELAALEQQLLCLRAIHERNQAAAQALEAFYKLAEVRGNSPTLTDSLGLLARMQDDLRKVKEEGLKVTADRTALDRKRLELLDQRAQLDLADAQLSEQLRGLIGLQPGEPTRLVPQADLVVTVEPIDVDVAISIGLTTRADLAALRLLQEELDTQTLPAARRGLSQTDPALGVPAPTIGPLLKILHVDTSSSELQIRRTQLTELLDSRQQQVASEIRLAAAEIQTRLRQAAIAGETLQSWQARVSDLTALRDVGSATPLEIQSAQLEVAAAHASLLKQAIGWRIAQVKLKQAQGLLAAECGYDAITCQIEFCP